MKRYIALTAVLAVVGLLGAGNSIFAYDGIPVRYYGNDVYGLSMGDTGSADVFRYNSGFANPALHNSSNRTLLATGLLFGFTRYQSEDNAGNRRSFVDNSLDLPYFSLSIPVKKHRLGFQFNSYASGLVNNEAASPAVVSRSPNGRRWTAISIAEICFTTTNWEITAWA
jgi:hypothetical protein